MKSYSYIPNFIPPYGTTKEVLLTKWERKEIGRRLLAKYVARMFDAEHSKAVVKSDGQYYAYSLIGWGFQLRVTGKDPLTKYGFRTLNEFEDSLFETHTEPELRRLAKVLYQRQMNAKARAGNLPIKLVQV